MTAPWTCHWPTKRALAVAEGTVELLELPVPELAVLVAEGAAVPEAPVVEDVPVLDVFFEHPTGATVNITATVTTNPNFTNERFTVIWLSLRSLSTALRDSAGLRAGFGRYQVL
jgi:hypothetical protein